MSHLFGAYGMFWDRQSVDWNPQERSRWQLMGVRGQNRPGLRVCDFRTARGFYILFDDHGATYVGLARGDQGLGQRLSAHDRDKPTWTRFCWFAFDDVADTDLDLWSSVQARDALHGVDADIVLRECEALLIEVLGTGRVLRAGEGREVKGQNSMNFLGGAIRWEQLREQDLWLGGRGRKVAPEGFTDKWLVSLLQD